jgi:hypothetical protein
VAARFAQLSAHLYYLQLFPRHKGMGSLPSATNTICSARIAGLPTGSDFFGMAQYIPVSAKATSRISAVRFMGEASGADLAPGEVYALEDLWITTNFRIASRHLTVASPPD